MLHDQGNYQPDTESSVPGTYLGRYLGMYLSRQWMFDVREIRGLPWFTAVGYGLAFHVTYFMLRGRIVNEDDQNFYMVLNIFQCFAMYGVHRCM